jgi:class 3 adenylate cyclase/tetratricopeptide (TPR) repeat protein
MAKCPACGHENRASARFCDSCGAPLALASPVREERKVVTVLFADLVGFTSRAEQLDPEDVRALLSPYYGRLRAVLEHFGGTVEKFIGDAVMALFGAPVAHEDDPERAVRAALAIRDWVTEEDELQVRIAVNTGEALVSLNARPEAGEGMASGDVVNTTARLQSAAPVNGILVGETTYRATKNVIDYREAEAVEAKGKAESIRVWEGVQARSRFGIDVVQQSRGPLVGRWRELDALRDTFTRARHEPSVQLVTLVGVPGIGKSRLVYELMQAVAAESDLVTWRQGRSLPYGEGVSLWALGEMVKAQTGVLETDTPEEVGAKLADSVGQVVAESESGWVERHLRTLIGLGDEDGAGGGGERRAEAFAAWRRYLEALAEQSPVVLVFEDLHWADDGLLDFVDHLVDWASDVPMLVVATARPELLERRPGWGGGKRNATTLSLAPLAEAETSQLISALLGRAVLPAEMQAGLLERAEGNPLYAEQYVRMLAERADELALPETIQGIIAARLDGLAPDEKELLQNAAVLGKVFWAGALGAIGGVERRRAEELLHSLERKEFVRRERRPSLAGEGEYSFRHVLVRDVAYGQIPRARRGDKHRLAGEWIESLGRPEDHAEMIAHHYARALELAEAAGQETGALAERARVTLRVAGDRAFALNAFPAAVGFYEQALELWPADEGERAWVLWRYGESLHLVGDERRSEVLEAAREALLEVGDDGTAAEAESLIAEMWWDHGQRDRAREHLEHARDLVADAAPSAAKARVLAGVARYLTLAEDADALGVAREALALADAVGIAGLRARSLNYLGLARIDGGDLGGLADLERAVEIAVEARSPEGAPAANNLAAATAFAGDLRRADELWTEAHRIAEEFGDARALRYLAGVAVHQAFEAGDWDECLRRADAFIAECEDGSPHYLEGQARSIRGAIRLARGDDEDALEDGLKSIALTRAARDPQEVLLALGFLVRTYVELGRREEAQPLLEELLTQFRNGVVGDPSTIVQLAWSAERVGRAGEIRELARGLEESNQWFRAARLALDGDFGRSAHVLQQIASMPEEAYARLRAAEVLVQDGRRAEADEQLQRALGFYRSVGATRYVREAEALLAATA